MEGQTPVSGSPEVEEGLPAWSVAAFPLAAALATGSWAVAGVHDLWVVDGLSAWSLAAVLVTGSCPVAGAHGQWAADHQSWQLADKPMELYSAINMAGILVCTDLLLR